jgi:hypothetical protein
MIETGIAFMEKSDIPVKNFLTNPVRLKSDKKPLEFKTAKLIATQKAKELCTDPMLLAWYQGKTGEYVPKTECSVGDKPAWIIYAESRGGDITIDINDEEYIFIYKSNPLND